MTDFALAVAGLLEAIADVLRAKASKIRNRWDPHSNDREV